MDSLNFLQVLSGDLERRNRRDSREGGGGVMEETDVSETSARNLSPTGEIYPSHYY